MCACACVRMRVCTYTCVRACMCVCMHVCVCVHACDGLKHVIMNGVMTYNIFVVDIDGQSKCTGIE